MLLVPAALGRYGCLIFLVSANRLERANDNDNIISIEVSFVLCSKYHDSITDM